jgi:hypothetical protein
MIKQRMKHEKMKDFIYRFFEWLDTAGLGFSQTDAAVWPEQMTARITGADPAKAAAGIDKKFGG